MADSHFAGRYEVLELLGSGGMARVHRARDLRMGRVVAIKTLLPELALDPDARRRFAREAHAAGVLNHPGIVTVHDQDEYHDGNIVVPYLVMEYVRGGTLSQLVRAQAPFEPARAVRICCDILDALAHAHAHGTVHRDVKPANVMITEQGAVKVTDFGIARVLDVDTRLTTAGSSVGTPSYMSPEQIHGGDVDARSDIYAIGCVLTELLTGKPPFHDGNPLNLMYWHVHTDPPAPSRRNPLVPADLDALVLAALAKDPAQRPPDAGVYRARLWAWLTASSSGTLTGPATKVLRDPARRPAQADPRSTFGVGAALPALPLQAQPPAQADAPSPAPPPQKAPAAPVPPAPQSGAAAPAPSTPPPSTPSTPAPSTPAPSTPAEHPAYSRNPQLPLPPPYMPSTPPPVTIGSTRLGGSSGAGSPASPSGPVAGGGPTRRWSTRRKALAGVTAVAIAGVTVSVVLVSGVIGSHGNDPSPTHPPTAPHQLTSHAAALALHGGTEGTGYNGGITGVVRPSSQTGGTVRLAVSYLDSALLDPADTYTQPAWNLQRLIMRKLVDYVPAPGGKGRALAPDLATDTGEVSKDGRTWTFHLKRGLYFEDGTPITSKDVKYGIERTFDRSVHGLGPTYFTDLLDQGQHYPGPYKDIDPGRLGLKSVATPDDSMIVFTLAKPYADFRYALALSIGAPVPESADRDGGKGYEDHPVASGPYMVKSYTPGSSLTLVRNPHWNQKTDTIHTQLPDGYELRSYSSQDEVDQALISGDADLDLNGAQLTGTTETQILAQSSLKAQTDVAYSGATRYLSLRTDVAPLNNVNCRKAVEYAVDRAQVRAAYGGPYEGGDVATTMMPPTNDAFDPGAKPYTGQDGKPLLDQAQGSLKACGRPDGFDVTLAGTNSGGSQAALAAVSNSLKAVGISATIRTQEAGRFYETLSSPSKLKSAKWGIVLSSWAADWPTGGGFLRTLVQPGDPGNYAGLDDSQVNAMVEIADTYTDPASGAAQWKKIDARVMQDATLVPLVYDRHLIYRGSRLTNVYQQQVLGGIDLVALGVKQ